MYDKFRKAKLYSISDEISKYAKYFWFDWRIEMPKGRWKYLDGKYSVTDMDKYELAYYDVWLLYLKKNKNNIMDYDKFHESCKINNVVFIKYIDVYKNREVIYNKID